MINHETFGKIERDFKFHYDFMSQDGHFFVYSLLCKSYEYPWDITVSIAWKNHFMKIVLSHEFTELVTSEDTLQIQTLLATN